MNKNLVYLCVLIVFCLSSLLYPASLDEEIDGSWVGKIKDDKIRLSFNIFDYGDNSGQWNTTTYFKRTEFSNLQLDKEHKFALKRDAGILNLFGKFSNNRGFGDFTFLVSDDFRGFLEKEGFTTIDDQK